MDIFLKVHLDLTEGKQMSTELVGEELANELDGASVQVEDSLFEVTEVEARQAKKTPSTDLGARLAALVDTYMAAFPLNIGNELTVHHPTDDELHALYSAVRHVITDDGAIGLVNTERRKAAARRRS